MKIISLLAATMLASSVFAADVPNYFYQPKGGAQSVEIGYSLLSLNYSPTLTVTRIPFAYTYGLSDASAFGISNSLSTASGSSTKTSGMEDWTLWYKGNSGNMFYGTSAILFSSSSSLTNNLQGGMSFDPYFGMDFNGLGFKVDYYYKMDRTNYQGGTTTLSGGNIMGLAGYYEMAYSAGKMDFVLSYQSYAASTLGGSAYGSGGSIMAFDWQGTYGFTKTAALTWDLGYWNLSTTGFTSASGPLIALGGRFEL